MRDMEPPPGIAPGLSRGLESRSQGLQVRVSDRPRPTNRSPYEKLKEVAEDSSGPLANAFAFILWPLLKASEPKHP